MTDFQNMTAAEISEFSLSGKPTFCYAVQAVLPGNVNPTPFDGESTTEKGAMVRCRALMFHLERRGYEEITAPRYFTRTRKTGECEIIGS